MTLLLKILFESFSLYMCGMLGGSCWPSPNSYGAFFLERFACVMALDMGTRS